MNEIKCYTYGIKIHFCNRLCRCNKNIQMFARSTNIIIMAYQIHLCNNLCESREKSFEYFPIPFVLNIHLS